MGITFLVAPQRQKPIGWIAQDNGQGDGRAQIDGRHTHGASAFGFQGMGMKDVNQQGNGPADPNQQLTGSEGEQNGFPAFTGGGAGLKSRYRDGDLQCCQPGQLNPYQGQHAA
jgi:hypothetical protein